VKNEISEIDEWLNNDANKKLLFEKPCLELGELASCEIGFLDCVRVGSKINTLNVWWKNQFLRDLYYNNSDLILSATRFFDASIYYTKILVTAIDTPGAGARVSMVDLEKLFFLLLAFNRHEQALWLGGRTYIGDTPERFSGRKDQVWTLREVSEWESLGGDEYGWRGLVARLRRLIPGQREKEGSAGRLDNDPMFPYWQEKPLCGYLLRLWLVMSGQAGPEEVPQGLPECGVYEGLFRNWNRPEELRESLREACDYHVRRSDEDGDGDYDVPEFSMRPYNVIPFEILAYRNVRKRMGLDTPMPAHPLLETPFVKNLPEELPPSDDPLLLEVLAAVRKVLPDV
jgi:hypothetical protein